MFTLPFELLLVTNAALLIIAGLLTVTLLRLGVLYVRNLGDSSVQSTQKKVILVLIILLLCLSLLAAAFNIFVSPL